MFIEALIKLEDGSEKTIKVESDNVGILLMRFAWKIKGHAKKENKLVHIRTDDLRILNYLEEHLPDVNVQFDIDI